MRCRRVSCRAITAPDHRHFRHLRCHRVSLNVPLKAALRGVPRELTLSSKALVQLGRIAIGDWLTALVGLVSLAILFRWKVSNPLLIAATAVVGLIAFPLLQPAWITIK
jgi:hypothetical protein